MKFVCDVMLGKLAKYLRILGFDAAYLKSENLLDRYTHEDPRPYFLTRRQKIFPYPRTIYVRSEHVREQIKELRELIKPCSDPKKFMKRCINCNVPLVEVEKEAIEHLVPEFVFHAYSLFMVCPQCSRVYWAGTHTQHMAELIEDLRV
jgi:uncharacterized protein